MDSLYKRIQKGESAGSPSASIQNKLRESAQKTIQKNNLYSGLSGFEVVEEPESESVDVNTETIVNINLYTQQWIVDIDAGTCTCTGGYIVVNNTVLINLAGSVVNFYAGNNNQVLVCQINPDFSVQWVWGAPGASSVVAAKPSVVCFWLALGTSTPLRQNARFYEYITYIATNPVIGV
jgi:hypothetical protein